MKKGDISAITTFFLLSVVLTQVNGITLHKNTTPKESLTKENSRHITTSSNRKMPAPEGPASINTFEVKCSDKMPSCVCPEDYLSCRFVLHVEELQTFTSYNYTRERDKLMGIFMARIKTKGNLRGTAGDAYYLNGDGFVPVLPPPPTNTKIRPPEYGNCYNKTDEFNKTCTTPITVDGATYRMIIGVNGQIPGPTLIVYENQIIQVRVVNKLTSEGISVHWHGMHQRNTPWMDGVGFITQPPIIPGAHFDYVFKAFPPGTHWYHSHVGAQRTDGLYGSLVVMEKEHPLDTLGYVRDSSLLKDLPCEHTISLLDWEREASLDLFVRIHSTLGFYPEKPVNNVPTQQTPLYTRTRSLDDIEVGPVPYWSGLMNGKGRHSKDTFSILSEFEVERGYSYRFRLVGAQSLYAYKFSIEGHRLEVIASDGHFIEKECVDYIIIHTGERYDFILNTDKDVDNYWMRAETLEVNNVEEHLAEGILHYKGASTPDPRNKYRDIRSRKRRCLPYRQCKAINCPFKFFPFQENTKCVHLDKLRAKIPASRTPKIVWPGDQNLKFFNFGFEGMSSTSAINGKNFKFPTTPYQTYCEEYDCNLRNRDVCPSESHTEYQTCIDVAQVATNQIYQPDADEYPSVNFVLSSVGSMEKKNNNFSHPIHLHGHTFFVVAIKHGDYKPTGQLKANNDDIDCGNDTESRCMSPHWTNDTPPLFEWFNRQVSRTAIRKDTVIVPAGGYVVIAFEASNPGYWFMHCHIESHQLEGMAVIVQEYPSSQQWLPPEDINRIGNFNWSPEKYNETVSEGKQCSSAT